MQNQTLTKLFADWLFEIPDYQRGYAWEQPQWNDFVQDLDALATDEVQTHYTGTVVVFKSKTRGLQQYGSTDKLEVADVVDGQQRLTTCCLYLSAIIRELIRQGEADFEQKKAVFLYSGSRCRLTLNNETGDIFHDLLKTGHATVPANSTHQKRLEQACAHLHRHLDRQLAAKGTEGLAYLKALYDAITRKLLFTFYEIEQECEIGMTFELMNSRGKGLSVLELLKNYLMHWISRNVEERERPTMTAQINKCWKGTYTNLGTCSGNEDQCLRVAWTLYCYHTPKYWKGYQGFKQNDCIPLREFGPHTKEKGETKLFIERLADGLCLVSRQYALITSPSENNPVAEGEFEWLTKIHHTGNIANFLPLMVAVRVRCETGGVGKTDYQIGRAHV